MSAYLAVALVPGIHGERTRPPTDRKTRNCSRASTVWTNGVCVPTAAIAAKCGPSSMFPVQAADKIGSLESAPALIRTI